MALQLRRSRGYATVVVLVWSLGIGVTTAVFSLVHSVLIRPLPFPESDRLVRIIETAPATGAGGARRTFELYTQNLARWGGVNNVTAVAAYHPIEMTWTGTNRRRRPPANR